MLPRQLSSTFRRGDVRPPARRSLSSSGDDASPGRLAALAVPCWRLVALQRGPLVYAAEAVDNGGATRQLVLDDDAGFETRHRPELLGGLTTVTARAAGGTIVMLPYHAWSHRGPGEMTVWFPRSAPV